MYLPLNIPSSLSLLVLLTFTPHASAEPKIQRRWSSSTVEGRSSSALASDLSSKLSKLNMNLKFNQRMVWTFHDSSSSDSSSSRLDDISNSPSSSNATSKNIPKPALDTQGNPLPPYSTLYSFDQLIDHSDPSIGTFQQRYFHTWEYYREGGPIIVVSPGEQSLTTRYSSDPQSDGTETDSSTVSDLSPLLTPLSLAGHLAERLSGAIVVLEHRFYGGSNPLPSLSTPNLKRLHTIDQAIEDLAHFARNVTLPMSTQANWSPQSLRPHRTPWILIGGSYAGALTAWTLDRYPDVFWAGYSSSGVVEPLLNFWQYYTPIQQHMPANCSADVARVMNYIDGVIDSQNGTLFAQIQREFGMPGVEVIPFLNMLTRPISDWQLLDVSSSEFSLFYYFCDILENPGDGSGRFSETGVGLERAFENWSSFFRELVMPAQCRTLDPATCVSLSFQSYLDTSLGNDDRSWWWTVCNEVGWIQSGAPDGVATSSPTGDGGNATEDRLVSKYLSVEAYESLCDFAFPRTFTPLGSESTYGQRVNSSLEKFKGWGEGSQRLFVVNGERDPWLHVTHSSALRPASLTSTPLKPIHLTDGFHCSDLWVDNGAFSTRIEEVQTEAVKVIGEWVTTFKPRANPSSGNDSGAIGVRTLTGTSLWMGLAVAGAVILLT